MQDLAVPGLTLAKRLEKGGGGEGMDSKDPVLITIMMVMIMPVKRQTGKLPRGSKEPARG
ncbi:MAG: hypothetical protein AB1753_06465 [Thermoproteota archaeon]